MITRKIALSFILLIAGILTFTVIQFTASENKVAAKSYAPNSETRVVDPPSNEFITINGQDNPEQIPDVVAYSIVLRMLSDRKTEEEQARGRSYIRTLFNFGCESCANQENSKYIKSLKEQKMDNAQALRLVRERLQGSEQLMQEHKADVNTVMMGVQDFQQRIKVLDDQVDEIKWRNWPDPNPQSIATLEELQRNKEMIVMDVMSKIKGSLSKSTAEIFDRRINEFVKPKIKVVLSPKSSEEERQRFQLQPVKDKQPFVN